MLSISSSRRNKLEHFLVVSLKPCGAFANHTEEYQNKQKKINKTQKTELSEFKHDDRSDTCIIISRSRQNLKGRKRLRAGKYIFIWSAQSRQQLVRCGQTCLHATGQQRRLQTANQKTRWIQLTHTSSAPSIYLHARVGIYRDDAIINYVSRHRQTDDCPVSFLFAGPFFFASRGWMSNFLLGEDTNEEISSHPLHFACVTHTHTKG